MRKTATSLAKSCLKLPPGRPLPAVLGLFVVGVAACGDKAPEGPPTYHKDIAGLIEKRCIACHDTGRIGPFPLTRWSEVQPRVKQLAGAVASGRMPPLPPVQNDECPRIDDPRAMLDAERELFARWVADGAPEGELPTRHREGNSSSLGEPSDRYPMPESYSSNFSFTDDYRCFLIDPKLTTPVGVTAVSVEPGNRAMMHHAAVYAIPDTQVAAVQALDAAEPGPGYTCFSGAGIVQAYPVGLWVPGYDAPTEPPRPTVGFYLPAGWQLVLQNHYNFNNGRGADQSTVTMWRAKIPIAEVPHTLYLSDTTFRLPAGAASTVRTMTADVVSNFAVPNLTQLREGFIYSAWAHMHLLGKSFSIDLVRQNGTRACLLRIPAWDFHWQSAYQFKKPVHTVPGDKVQVTCEWDNSPAKQPAIGGPAPAPRDVFYGEKTTDEMCIGTLALLDIPY